MASTSVHLPEVLLRRLDRLAARIGLSRNRLIIRACEALVEEDLGEWPDGFFADDRLSAEELEEMRCGVDQMVEAIGGYAEYVENPGDVSPAVERALASGKPSLVNISVRSGASPLADAMIARRTGR